MAVYKIGTILKQVRKEKKISQLDMCRGLCTKAMVSYIENEERVPHRKLIELLFSRLGEPFPVENVPMTKADFYRYNLERKINGMVARELYDIAGLLDEYASCKKDMTKLEMQFYEFYRTFYENRNYDLFDKILPELVHALQITISDFKLYEFPEKKLLSRTEIFLLNNISRCHFYLGEKEGAVLIQNKLKDYFESGIVSEVVKASTYPLVLFNLSNWERVLNCDEHILEYSEIALKYLLNYGKLNLLPYHLFNKGLHLAKNETLDSGKQYLSISRGIFHELSNNEELSFTENLLKESFGDDFLKDLIF
ncbi:helix-turn-helix domain-containing protein [Treponema zioleckii]|uniref:helix-turn-helix domain-containing protein n=1 Tax=Treponema zioleckii TaxID=331680 RepID=UPI00168B69C4|nr:helix-turn-helix transcriptional regulator [Treponema zioleckii]